MSPEQFLLTWNQAPWILYDLVPMDSCFVLIISFLVSMFAVRTFFSHLDVGSFIKIIDKSGCILVSSYSRTKVLIDKQPNLDLMFLAASRKFLKIRIINWLKELKLIINSVVIKCLPPVSIPPQAKVVQETTGPRAIILRGPS